MEQPTSKDAATLFDQLLYRLEQLEAIACYFNREDFETLLDALDIMNREAIRHVGVTH